MIVDGLDTAGGDVQHRTIVVSRIQKIQPTSLATARLVVANKAAWLGLLPIRRVARLQLAPSSRMVQDCSGMRVPFRASSEADHIARELTQAYRQLDSLVQEAEHEYQARTASKEELDDDVVQAWRTVVTIEKWMREPQIAIFSRELHKSIRHLEKLGNRTKPLAFLSAQDDVWYEGLHYRLVELRLDGSKYELSDTGVKELAVRLEAAKGAEAALADPEGQQDMRRLLDLLESKIAQVKLSIEKLRQAGARRPDGTIGVRPGYDHRFAESLREMLQEHTWKRGLYRLAISAGSMQEAEEISAKAARSIATVCDGEVESCLAERSEDEDPEFTCTVVVVGKVDQLGTADDSDLNGLVYLLSEPTEWNSDTRPQVRLD